MRKNSSRPVLQKLINLLAFNRTRPGPIMQPLGRPSSSAYSMFLKSKLDEVQRRVRIAGTIDYWESPPMPFSSMISRVELDTDMLDSFGFLVDASVGQGYVITAEDQGIVDHVIENFMEPVMADEITLVQAFEDLTYGSSFWLKTPETGNFLTWYKLGAILAARLNEQTFQPQYFMTTAYENIIADNLIHLTWRRSNARAFGLGLAYPLLEEVPYNTYKNDGTPETLVRPAITEMKKQMQHDALIRNHKFTGRVIISAQVDDNTKLKDFAEELNSPYTGIDHLVNYPVEVKESNMGRRIMENDVKNMIDEEYIKASGNPETKLITAQGYTEASALAAIKAASIRLASFERYMSKMWQSNIIRMWYDTDPYIDANGVPVPWKIAKIKIEWGKEDHGVMDAASFVQLISNIGVLQSQGVKILTSKEIRKNLRRFQLELDADETIIDETVVDAENPMSGQELEKLAEQVANIENKTHKLAMVLKDRRNYR